MHTGHGFLLLETARCRKPSGVFVRPLPRVGGVPVEEAIHHRGGAGTAHPGQARPPAGTEGMMVGNDGSRRKGRYS